MLILTRNVGKEIVIYGAKPEDEIIICVLGVNGNQVRLGAQAPKHVTIHRREIQDRIDSEEQV